jgi:replicative DNA helicase
MGLNDLKNKVNSIDKKLSLKAPYQLVDDWIDNELEIKKNPMTTGFEDFDKDLRSNLRGKLGIFAGYGGSKKSLFALNLSCHNAFNQTGKAIYSTMEMSATNLLDRMIDFQYGRLKDGIISMRAVDYWRSKLTEESKTLIKEQLELGLNEFYGDRLLISQQSRMKPTDYKDLIERALENNQEINTLIVDGLSMMGGMGSEVELYSENTAHLKEIANEYNIFVGLIAHLSKGADIDTRDVRPFIRGSQKILDNCDFAFMFSLIKDVLNDGEVEKDKGYIRLINKRGTGNIINQIYNFDEDRLLLYPSDIDPLNYGDDVQQSKKQYG